jgi:spermidine synthase
MEPEMNDETAKVNGSEIVLKRFFDVPGLLLATILFFSSGILIYEISLTRIFSVLMRYHFVFLTVSLSMCGLGVGGMITPFLRRKMSAYPKKDNNLLEISCIAAALTMPLSIVLIFLTPLKSFLTSITFIPLVPFIPFLCAGVFFSHLFEIFGNFSGKIYFADLAGAAIGCLLVIPILQLVGGLNATLAAGAFCLASCFLLGLMKKKRIFAICSMVFLFCTVLLSARSGYGSILGIASIKTKNAGFIKPLYQAVDNPVEMPRIIYSEWNAFAKTDVVEFPGINLKYIYTDGDVPSTMQYFNGDFSSISDLKQTVFYLPFYACEAKRVLSIGPGGGLDILVALLGGSKEVTGVEINRSIFSIMKRFSWFNGGLYDRPEVNVFLDDGRNFIRRSQDTYDIIYLALTQTATTQSGTFVLNEGYIHTVEAFRDYILHLNENGVLVFVTQDRNLLFRAILSTLSVLSKISPVDESRKHLLALAVSEEAFSTTPYRYALMVRKQPFSPALCSTILEKAQKQKFQPVYVPFIHESILEGRTFQEITRKLSRESGPAVNLAPCSDDSPFFLDLSFGIPGTLVRTLLAVIVIAFIYSFLVIKGNQIRTFGRQNVYLAYFAFYFALLGTGYMLIEVILIQKFMLFLGHPTLSITAVVCCLLLGSGIGSFSTRSWREKMLARVCIAATGVALMVALYTVILNKIFAVAISEQLITRLALTFVLVFPLGYFMGMPFPAGMKVLKQLNGPSIPWMWGINGLMSVAGSILAMICGKSIGFTDVFLIAACLYGMVALAGLVIEKGLIRETVSAIPL